MRAIVLGAAAGGGFPQWNSNAPACRRARAGDPAARPRTQASLAVSGDDVHWTLINASPDLGVQIARTVELHPRHGLRSTPIAAVVLTCGEVDAIAGLLTLRESQRFDLYATTRTQQVLAANPIFDVLNPSYVTRHAAALDCPIALPGGLGLTLFAVPGKPPLFLEAEAEPHPEDTVGVELSHQGARLVCIPGCAAMTPALARRLCDADAILFDGTLWEDDEMIRAGLGGKTGRRMGHMSVSGPGGVLDAFAGIPAGRKILIHINNSNPVLLENSSQRALAEAAGWRIAHDGMDLTL
jgi:pyrroloquinoline quinone biosynthesis protein B